MYKDRRREGQKEKSKFQREIEVNLHMEKAENEQLESLKRTRRDVYQQTKVKDGFKEGVVNSVRYCSKLK